eukprot:SAG31_NODE_229_length_19770_cov_9.887194_10_plen_77_part_00
MSLDCGFGLLAPGSSEPSGVEMAQLIDEIYGAVDAREMGSMGERDLGIVFAGAGGESEPLIYARSLFTTDGYALSL